MFSLHFLKNQHQFSPLASNFINEYIKNGDIEAVRAIIVKNNKIALVKSLKEKHSKGYKASLYIITQNPAKVNKQERVCLRFCNFLFWKLQKRFYICR